MEKAITTMEKAITLNKNFSNKLITIKNNNNYGNNKNYRRKS